MPCLLFIRFILFVKIMNIKESLTFFNNELNPVQKLFHTVIPVSKGKSYLVSEEKCGISTQCSYYFPGNSDFSAPLHC